MKKQKNFKERGITLVALVVTIIILLILAGISIATLTGSGLFEKTRLAEQEYKNSEDKENSTLSQYENIMNSYLSGASKNEETNKPTVEIQDTHTTTTLTYSWEELEQIANIISDNDDTITNDTSEVQVTIGENVYTVGVGDLAVVTYNGTDKTVRLMGFNHDTLSDTAAYGEGKNNTYAGISFEFMDIIKYDQMNSSDNNTNGWGGCTLRGKLNGDTELNKLGNISQIKQVNKIYLLGNKSSTTQVSQDRLWLLSCSEIWSNGYNGTGTYGYAISKEGEQYKYYNDLNAMYDIANENVRKGTGTKNWWLRSPYKGNSTMYLRAIERCYWGNSAASRTDLGIAPGFAI